MVVEVRVGHILRPSLQAVLADDDGALPTLADAFGHEEDAVAEDVIAAGTIVASLLAIDVEDDLVAAQGGGVIDEAAARAQGATCRGQLADDVAGEGAAVALG